MNLEVALDDDEDDEVFTDTVSWGEEEEEEDEEMLAEEEEEEDGIALLLKAPKPHLDQSMRLTEEEHDWACQLKLALIEESQADLGAWTDMEVAHFALISEGSTENALQRMRGMHAFRQEYKVDNSPAQGVKAIEGFMRQQQGLLLCIDVETLTWESLRVIDVGGLNSSAALESDQSWRDFIVGDYYLYYTCQPTLATVRQGCYTMIDFKNFGWRQWNMELQHRFAAELFVHYPVRFKKMLCFNTGSVANVCWSLVKRVYPCKALSVLQLGGRVPLEGDQEFPPPLRERYLQPNLQEAYAKQLEGAKQLLELRARNEAGFRL